MTKTATRVERKSRKQSTSVLEPTTPIATMGDATTAIFLLSDYEKFGLSERVSQIKLLNSLVIMFPCSCCFMSDFVTFILISFISFILIVGMLSL
jgi:hypothetical protein